MVESQRPYINLRDIEAIPQGTPKKLMETPLRIAVSPSLSNRDTAGYYRQLSDHIAVQTGRPTELIYRRSNSEVQALLASNGADIGFFSTGTYLAYAGPVELEILVIPERAQGPYYQALVIVPGDSPAEEIADLAGKSFAFNDSLSFSGYIFPRYLLKQLHNTPENFFRQTVFTQSHSKSLQAVAMHMLDGAAIDSIAFDHARKNTPELANSVRIIHLSPSAGTGPIVIRNGIDEAKKDLLRTVFLNMHHNQDMRQVLRELMFERFVSPQPHLYDYPSRILAEVKNSP
jgi:phosphonate transport system substrate-binding protein